jgi:hypothetical protein
LVEGGRKRRGRRVLETVSASARKGLCCVLGWRMWKSRLMRSRDWDGAHEHASLVADDRRSAVGMRNLQYPPSLSSVCFVQGTATSEDVERGLMVVMEVQLVRSGVVVGALRNCKEGR